MMLAPPSATSEHSPLTSITRLNINAHYTIEYYTFIIRILKRQHITDTPQLVSLQISDEPKKTLPLVRKSRARGRGMLVSVPFRYAYITIFVATPLHTTINRPCWLRLRLTEPASFLKASTSRPEASYTLSSWQPLLVTTIPSSQETTLLAVDLVLLMPLLVGSDTEMRCY